MARLHDNISLEEFSRALREAREKKGWTLEQLSHELWERGFATSQNKLWRMEKKPPRRLDTELLMWLEKVLEVQLIDSGHKDQVLIADVLELISEFTKKDTTLPEKPKNQSLHAIHEKLCEIRALEKIRDEE